MADDIKDSLDDLSKIDLTDLSKNLGKVAQLIQRIGGDTKKLNTGLSITRNLSTEMMSAQEEHAELAKIVLNRHKEIESVSKNIADIKKDINTYESSQSDTPDYAQMVLDSAKEELKVQHESLKASQKALAIDGGALSISGKRIKATMDLNKMFKFQNEMLAKSESFANRMFGWLDKLNQSKSGSVLAKSMSLDKVKETVTRDAMKIFSSMNKGTTSASKGFSQLTGVAVNGFKNIGKSMLANPWMLLLFAITTSIERFVELDRAAEQFRKNTGLTVGQMRHMLPIARELNVQFKYMGIGLEEAYRSMESLVKAFGVSWAVSKEVTKSIALMAANLGIAEEDSGRVLQNMMGMSMLSQQTSLNTMAIGSHLAHLAGVPAHEVFKDIANASAATIMFLGKSPMLMMRTAVEARRLGTTIESLSKSARGMLNFQESINAEMEATALTGVSLNFQLSRQLAFEGKIGESRKAARDQLKKLGDFAEMNVYQQEAAARAAGMEVDEIVKMQAQEKMLQALRNSGDKSSLDLLRQYEATQAEIEKGDTRSALAKAQEHVMTMQRQGEITKITNQLKALWLDIQDALLPIAKVLMPIISMAVKILAPIIKFIAAVIQGMLAPIEYIGDLMGHANEKAEGIRTSFEGISDWVTTVGKSLGMAVLAAGGLIKLLSILPNVLNKSNWTLGSMVGKLKAAATWAGSKVGGLFGLGKSVAPVAGTSAMSQVTAQTKNMKGGSIIKDFFSNLSAGISKMGGKGVLRGALGLAVVGAALIPFAFGVKMLQGIEWKTIGMAAAAMGIMTAALVAIGLVMSSGVGTVAILAGAAAMLIMGTAMIPFAYGAKLLGEAMPALTKGLSDMVDPLLALGSAAPMLMLGAAAVGALGASFYLLSAGMIAASVGSFFGGGIFGRLESLSKMSGQLRDAASSITEIGRSVGSLANTDLGRLSRVVESLGQLRDLETVIPSEIETIVDIPSVNGLTESIDRLTQSVESLKERISEVETSSDGGKALLAKFDEFTTVLRNGGVVVNLDGRKVSSVLTNYS